ncbi:MAG: nucleoid occlusion protein [Firmicutes bacterium]|jgi:ParB family chromosome partitioning protein|nr:nucleoid occlusion protein [Bacillota bacterium]
MNENWSNKKIRFFNKEGNKEEVKLIKIEKIKVNPYQPRKTIEEIKLQELAQSIKTYGLLQPIIVTEIEDEYQIVAGERRFLACQSLGWDEIPALVRDYNDSSVAAVALIENLQRENLNYIEEAYGYKRLIEEFNLTQEVLAQRLGKSQSTIANKLRLLKLPDNIKNLLQEEKLTERHARALLKLDSEKKQQTAVEIMINMDLNVKEAEELVQQLNKEPKSEDNSKKHQRRVIIRDLRIFLNTIRQAVSIIRKAGLEPLVEENDMKDYWEIRIRLPKKSKNKKYAVK